MQTLGCRRPLPDLQAKGVWVGRGIGSSGADIPSRRCAFLLVVQLSSPYQPGLGWRSDQEAPRNWS